MEGRWRDLPTGGLPHGIHSFGKTIFFSCNCGKSCSSMWCQVRFKQKQFHVCFLLMPPLVIHRVACGQTPSHGSLLKCKIEREREGERGREREGAREQGCWRRVVAHLHPDCAHSCPGWENVERSGLQFLSKFLKQSLMTAINPPIDDQITVVFTRSPK